MKIYIVRNNEHVLFLCGEPYIWGKEDREWICSRYGSEMFTLEKGDMYRYLLTLVPKVEEPVEIEL